MSHFKELKKLKAFDDKWTSARWAEFAVLIAFNYSAPDMKFRVLEEKGTEVGCVSAELSANTGLHEQIDNLSLTDRSFAHSSSSSKRSKRVKVSEEDDSESD